MKSDALLFLVDRFLDGTDTSARLAGELEVLLDDAFPEDDLVQTVVVALASYAPGGGPQLYDEAMLRETLTNARPYLASRLHSHEPQ